MAAVLHRTTKQYHNSVNTPDYPAINWIINPDISLVTEWANKYWVITGDTVTLMAQAARDAVDLAESEAGKESLSTNLDRTLKAFVLAVNDGSFIPGSNYTNPAIKSIIRAKL